MRRHETSQNFNSVYLYSTLVLLEALEVVTSLPSIIAIVAFETFAQATLLTLRKTLQKYLLMAKTSV